MTNRTLSACEAVELCTALYVELGVDSQLGSLIDDHVLRCPKCEELLSESRRVLDLSALALAARPTDGMVDGVIARLPPRDRAVPALFTGAGAEPASVSAPPRVAMSGWIKAAAMVGAVALAATLGGTLTETRRELADLRTDLTGVRTQLALSSMKQSSAHDRVEAVFLSRQIANPSPDVLDALFMRLRSDPSVNVRLAIVDALESWSRDERIVGGVMDAMDSQSSSSVRVALIELLALLGSRHAIPVLTDLAQVDQDPAVRERAAQAVRFLSEVL